MLDQSLKNTGILSGRDKIAYLIGLSFMILILPAIIHSQWFSGPIVNAVLILGAVLLGRAEAISLGLIPSTVALSGGLLPLPFAPMVPFIMISNAIFILGFMFIANKTKSFTAGIIISAIFKSAFLFAIISTLMPNFISGEMLSKFSFMFSWPQLLSALIGGFIAFTILKISKKI